MEINSQEKIKNEIKKFCRALFYKPKEFFEMCDADVDPSDLICSDKILLDKFNNILASLKKELCLKYLSDEEKETRFASFAFKIISEIDLYKREPKKINEKINEFLNDIIRPVNEIEFFFPITNLKIEGNEKIGNVIIKNISEHDFKIMIESSSPEAFDPFKGRFPSAFAVIVERGNSRKIMTERAIKKVDLALDILRVSLRTDRLMQDVQTLFARNDLILWRRKEELGKVEYSLDRGFEPIQLEIDFNDDSRYKLYLNQLSNTLDIEFISKKLLESLKRTIIWIGRSITENDIDLKIIYLCIALESILTTKDEGRKGEAIAYRMLLMHFCLRKFVLFPEDALVLYELRSRIIHEGEIGFATEDNYNILRYISTEILINSLSIIKNNGIIDKKMFIEKLESKENIMEVKSWLEAYRGASAKKILKWINDKE